ASEIARNGRVWWLADSRGALYYGIRHIVNQLECPQSRYGGGMQVVDERNFACVSAQEPPTLVLLSKPDSYDQQNAVSNYLAINRYNLVESFPAFTAWRR